MRIRFPRPLWWVPVVVVVAIAAVLGAVYVLDREDLRIGSEAVGGPPLEITRDVTSYRITYRVEDHAGRDVAVSTQRVEVRRPLDIRAETLDGPPPGERVTATTVYSLAGLMQAEPAVPAAAISPSPSLAGPDIRFDVVIDDAVREGLMVRRERRRVLDRDCQVYRASGPLQVGGLSPVVDGDLEYVDACVDEAGLLLEEVWFMDAGMMRRRIATDVDENPHIPDDRFVEPDEDGPRPPSRGGTVLAIAPGSRPAEGQWEPVVAPDGFGQVGRFAVVPDEPFRGQARPDDRATSVVEVWTRGADVVLVETGRSVGGADVFGPSPHARRVGAGELGEGEVLIGLRANEIRFRLDGGSFVRVTGTLPAGDLVEIAGTLRLAHGDGLVCLDAAGQPGPCVPARPDADADPGTPG